MTAQETRALQSIARHAGEGEAIWFNNDLLVLKATGEDTADGMVVVEELARRGKVTPLHTHPTATESFYLLDGEALFFADGREVSMGAGGFVSVPARRPPRLPGHVGHRADAHLDHAGRRRDGSVLPGGR